MSAATAPAEPTPGFPFVAVVGQEMLKRALLLATVEPRLGGVLIQGPRGVAKSTLARGLADLLPSSTARFVDLPLGASAERLTGSLDLERALRDRALAFQPGLFAAADGGVLYIDEVNLLDDALVDLLLDVAASNVNRVERDGLSHAHSSRFVLIGTMNPEEGALRPQLCDRFGLSVAMEAYTGVEARIDIVRARLAFEAAPEAFIARHADATRALRQRLLEARERLPDVTIAPGLERLIAERCIAAQVDGLRADIAWQRAARAQAALSHRLEVVLEDIDAVEPLVLDHRLDATAAPPPASTPPSTPVPGGGRSASSLLPSGAGHNQGTRAAPRGDGEGCSAQRHLQPERRDTRLPAPTAPSRPHSYRGAKRTAAASARGPVDWFTTLSMAANRGPGPLRALARHAPTTRAPGQVLVLLDLSASTLSHRALDAAAGLVLGIAQRSRRFRQRFALLGFGAGRLDWICDARRAPGDLAERLARRQARGGTPLCDALAEGRRMLDQRRRRLPGVALDTWLIGDGRCREDFSNQRRWPGRLRVIDSERGRVLLGRARTLADVLGGDYQRLDEGRDDRGARR